MESAEEERALNAVKMDIQAEKCPLKEAPSEVRNNAAMDRIRGEGDGQKEMVKSVQFSDDATSREDHNPVTEDQSKFAQGQYESADQMGASADPASSNASTRQSRDRSQVIGKQSGKRSQTSFRRRIIVGNGSDDDNDDSDDNDNDGSRSKERTPSEHNAARRNTEGRHVNVLERNTNAIPQGPDSMKSSRQARHTAPDETALDSTRREDQQCEGKDPKVEINSSATQDAYRQSEGGRLPSCNTPSVTKSPVSTSVRFIEPLRYANEEQADSEITAGTKSELPAKDSGDSLEKQSPRGRQRTMRRKPARRSQTPFQHCTIRGYGSDDDNDDSDDNDNDGSRSKERTPSEHNAARRNTEGRHINVLERNTNAIPQGPDSMKSSRQARHTAPDETALDSTRREDQQCEGKDPKVEINSSATQDAYRQSEGGRLPSCNTPSVTKSPVSTSVRFIEPLRYAKEEQADSEITAGTKSELPAKDSGDSLEKQSPRGRQRTMRRKPARRSQTPFQHCTIRGYGSGDDNDDTDKDGSRSSQVPFNCQSFRSFDSDNDKRGHVHSSHRNIHRPANRTFSDCSESDISKPGAPDKQSSFSLRPWVTFALETEPDRGSTAETHSYKPVVSSRVRFSEPTGGSAQGEIYLQHPIRDSVEAHAGTQEASSTLTSPRGRQLETKRNPARRSPTPFNRRRISTSDDDDDDETTTRSRIRSLFTCEGLDPSASRAAQLNDKPSKSVSPQPRVTLVDEIRSPHEAQTFRSSARTPSSEGSSLCFVEPAIVRSDQQAGDAGIHEGAEDMHIAPSETSSKTLVPRGRQPRRNRKPGKRSPTPFSRLSVNIYTSDDDNMTERNIDQSTTYTSRPSGFKPCSDASRVFLNGETWEQRATQTKHLTTAGKEREQSDMSNSARGSPVRVRTSDSNSRPVLSHPKGYASAWDDENGVARQFSKDSDIDTVCRSISRVTLASSQASGDILLFDKGTQINPTCDAATETTIDDMLDRLYESHRISLGTTDNRIHSRFASMTQWIAGMLGNCY